MKKFVVGLLLLSIACQLNAITYTKTDSMRVVRLLSDGLKQNKNTNLMIYYARRLKGLPYVAKTLEVNPTEQLIVNLRQLDCTTYVENVLALTLCTEKSSISFKDFCRILQKIRYDGGNVRYTSRLHYFTSWIANNTKNGFVFEIQKQSSPFTATQIVKTNYMTTHIDSYPMLVEHPEWVSSINAMEKELTGKRFRYIPKGMITNSILCRNIIKDGDIIAIITSKPGLDTSHIGIAVWHNDGLHLLNASQIRKNVVEESMTLHDYMKKHPLQLGIRVIRVK